MCAAELGQTSDPKALIPGEATALTTAAASLRGHGAVLEDVAAGLSGVKIDGWFGSASNAFWDRFNPEPAHWRRAADAMTAGAYALERQADAVRAAQLIAEEAIELWEQGEQATRAAEAARAGKADGEPEVTDPGEALRQEARQVLNRGREQLEEIGSAVAEVLASHGGSAPGAPPWLVAAGSANFGLRGEVSGLEVSGIFAGESPSITGKIGEHSDTSRWFDKDRWGGEVAEAGPGSLYDALDRLAKGDEPGDAGLEIELGSISRTAEFTTAQAAAGFSGQVGDLAVAGAAEAKLGGEAEGKVTLTTEGVKAEGKAFVGGQASVAGEMRHGEFAASGSAGVKGGAEATVSAEIGTDGVRADAGASVGVTAETKGEVSLGPGELGASGEAFAGAEAEGNVSLDERGLHAGVEAFAGAKAEGEVHADVGGIGAGLTGEAWAGVGAEANVDFGFDENGTFTIGGEVGAGLGVGGKVGGEITIDPAKVMETAQGAGAAISDGAAKMADFGKDLAGAFGG
ncbi:putative T7SS-secreted protein [Amycolatopsis suaedae]|uniref:Putative T7SS secretion signal domain-containing protein n=1 Tax=Amycolatopsis suaedae TaxID=2510978 RepID=A0A4Q7JD33_9PSEU|nr:hypothetical protein [Amycolatopsis suaedae]RZQ64503.1 hypothetical protein EWH70_06170 [Amycolatopsis suaedae]